MKKKMLLCLAFMTLFIFMTGCSLRPEYYSDKDVVKYAKNAFGIHYELIHKIRHDYSGDENPTYEYVFTNEDITFSVYTSTGHISIDASETAFYEKYISNDYVESVIKKNIDKVNEICDNASFDIELNKYYHFNLNLDNYEQIEEASQIIENLDSLLALQYDYNIDSYKEGVYINLKPDYKTDDSDEEYPEIGEVFLSHNDENRLKKADVQEEIEKSLVNIIKNQNLTMYKIPDDLLYKYEAQYIKVNQINKEPVSEILCYAEYDEDTELYWFKTFDICQDFDDFPYNYIEEYKSFAEIVNMLGGTYECDDWNATWKIGDDVWNATLYTDDNYEYIDMSIEKNGEKLILSDNGDIGNKTVSGRAYTVADLEKMLNVNIEIDQKSMTASMNAWQQ